MDPSAIHDDAADQHQDGDSEAPVNAVPTSLLPPPPSSSSRFTARNVERWAVLDAARRGVPSSEKGKARQLDDEQIAASNAWLEQVGYKDPATRLNWQKQVLLEAGKGASSSQDANEGVEAELPDFDVLLDMDPPRVDWIEEDGSYLCFGDRWPIPTVYPNLKQMGATQLYPDGPIDRRQALLTLLRTYLLTHHNLISLLTKPPRERLTTIQIPQLDQPSDETTGLPPTQEVEVWKGEAQENWEFMGETVRNMQHLVNEARPGQARENAVALLRAQVERRRAETARLKDEIARTREALRAIGRRAGEEGSGKGPKKETGDVEMA